MERSGDKRKGEEVSDTDRHRKKLRPDQWRRHGSRSPIRGSHYAKPVERSHGIHERRDDYSFLLSHPRLKPVFNNLRTLLPSAIKKYHRGVLTALLPRMYRDRFNIQLATAESMQVGEPPRARLLDMLRLLPEVCSLVESSSPHQIYITSPKRSDPERRRERSRCPPLSPPLPRRARSSSPSPHSTARSSSDTTHSPRASNTDDVPLPSSREIEDAKRDLRLLLAEVFTNSSRARLQGLDMRNVTGMFLTRFGYLPPTSKKGPLQLRTLLSSMPDACLVLNRDSLWYLYPPRTDARTSLAPDEPVSPSLHSSPAPKESSAGLTSASSPVRTSPSASLHPSSSSVPSFSPNQSARTFPSTTSTSPRASFASLPVSFSPSKTLVDASSGDAMEESEAAGGLDPFTADIFSNLPDGPRLGAASKKKYYSCAHCMEPVLEWVRLVPCTHALCVRCMPDENVCPRCNKEATDRARLSELYFCPVRACQRSYLYEYSVSEHVKLRHSEASS